MWPHLQNSRGDRAHGGRDLRLEADSQPSNPLADQPPSSLRYKKNTKAKASGLFGLSRAAPWGFNVYRGAIVASWLSR